MRHNSVKKLVLRTRCEEQFGVGNAGPVAVGGRTPPTATSLMYSVPNCSPQQLLGIDFPTKFMSQKQSTDELCEVLNLGW